MDNENGSKKRKQYFPINSPADIQSFKPSRLNPMVPQGYDGPLRVLLLTEEEHTNYLALLEAAKKWKTVQDNLEEEACRGFDNIAAKRNEKLYQIVARMM